MTARIGDGFCNPNLNKEEENEIANTSCTGSVGDGGEVLVKRSSDLKYSSTWLFVHENTLTGLM